MKPFFILITVFVLYLFITRFNHGEYHHFISGRVAMSVMLLFTAIGHFKYVNGMEMMVPDLMPFKKVMVYFTGLLEIAFAIGLLYSPTLKLTGWILIAFLILVMPANIKAAKAHIDYQKATLNGPGPKYLWFRIPLQLFFIAWVWFFALYR